MTDSRRKDSHQHSPKERGGSARSKAGQAINIEDVRAPEVKPVVNSPRTLSVCAMEGILPTDL